ncbi:MAG TPA: ATP synthase subunit I [Terriglobia bacterium]|nr:ATP synthase subunit I [Terriglobia bacterium]
MIEEDRLEGLDRRLNRSSLVVVLIAMPLVLFLHSAKAALSIGAGAALSYMNFHWLKQAVDFVVLEGAEGRKARRVLFRFVARYALIALFLYVTIYSSVLELVFVFAGLLVYVAAILIECVSEVCRVLIRDYRNART